MRHVMNAVKRHHQIKAVLRQSLGSGQLESDAALDPGSRGLVLGPFDRRGIDVVAEKARAGVRYGHGNDALSRTAAYLANFRSLQELFVELGDRRNPLARD